MIYKEISATNESVGFFFTNALNEDAKGNRSERECPDFEKHNSFSYFLHYTVNPQRWAVHRTILENVRFDEEVVICEDMDTSLRVLAAGHPVFQIKELTTVYVSAMDSFTMSDLNKAEKELYYLKKIFARKELKGKLAKGECNRLKSMCHFHLSVKYYDQKNRIFVYFHAFKSFLLYPKGYNGRTNKILLVNCIYSIPVISIFLRWYKKGKKK